MRTRIWIVLVLLVPFLLTAFATENIGRWEGESRKYGSVSNSGAFIQFTGADKQFVSLNLLTDHDFSWDEGDTVSGSVAGVTGALNITGWTGTECYYWWKHASSKTNVDVWLQSAPTDSGPWVNQIQLIDSSRTTTATADTVDLSAAGPWTRLSYVNEDSCLTTAEVDYFYLVLKKP